MSVRTTVLPFALCAATGCRGCHENHPFVPYAIESAKLGSDTPAGASGPSSLPTAPSGSGRTPFQGASATPAPPGLARWAIDDVLLQAPGGRAFVSAIVRDFDVDGAKDAFAIVRPTDGSDPGELAYYRGRQGTESLQEPTMFAPPVAMPFDTNCNLVARLVAAGRRSVLVELGATCPLHSSTAPDRWVAVLSVEADARVRLAATIADPPGAPELSVDGDTTDRDGDGLEDVSLRVTIEGGGAPLEPGPRVGAVFAWLDRMAGLSRDVAATESSFAALAATAAARAVRAKEAPGVSGYVEQVRALWRSACADGGAPRVVGVAGTGAITCGAARALEDIGLAEVRAYVTMTDPLRAALALDRAEHPPAARTGTRASEAQRWITQLAPVASARALRAVAAIPIAGAGHEPSWGSLMFEPSGKLLVRTRAGVVRVDPDAGDEATADGVADWKPAVLSPDGATRWIEAYDPCDGLPLHATFAPIGGDEIHDVALPIAAPLGDRCVGSRGAPARALPIAWGPGGLEAMVEGEPILVSLDLLRSSRLVAFLSQPVTPGAPRSPDGRTFIVATGEGLMVRTAARARLFRAPELDGTYGDQRDCAVSNDGVHAACVRAGKAWVGTWDGG